MLIVADKNAHTRRLFWKRFLPGGSGVLVRLAPLYPAGYGTRTEDKRVQPDGQSGLIAMSFQDRVPSLPPHTSRSVRIRETGDCCRTAEAVQRIPN